jgi:hypothetical protein
MSDQARRLACGFRRSGAAATVELLTAEAPAICQALWERLPIEAESYHTKWNGAELYVVLPPYSQFPADGLTGDVRLGDVVVFQFDASYRGAPADARRRGLGDYAELGFFYGPLVRAYGPAGPVQGIRVGRIVRGLEALADAARGMRRTGFEPMILTAAS